MIIHFQILVVTILVFKCKVRWYLTASPSPCLPPGEFPLHGVFLPFPSSPSLLGSLPTSSLQVNNIWTIIFCFLSDPISSLTGGQGGGKHLRTSFIPSARWYLLQLANFCKIIDELADQFLPNYWSYSARWMIHVKLTHVRQNQC